jgi:hypothetical protein
MRLRVHLTRAYVATAARAARRGPSRDGFALPLAIMVLALLTMGLVAGFAASSSEISTTVAQRSQAKAYSFAQMGLEQFLTRRKEVKTSAGAADTFCKHCWLMNKSAPPSGSAVLAKLDTLPTRKETTYVAFRGGAAIIRAVPIKVDVATGKGMYLVTSTGIDSMSGTLVGRSKTKYATRTVGVFVSWNKSTMNVMGALVSFSGIVKNGTGDISGIDACGADTNVAGINVPANESVDVMGSSFTPTGNPPYDTLKTFAQDSALAQLDWAGISGGTAMPADIIVTATSSYFPSWGTFASDTNYWPIIHVQNRSATWTGNWTLPNQGRGTLIVDGDLTISGSNQWDGVVLAGGKLTSNGNNVTSGTVMAGLNRLIGIPAGAVDDANLNGTKSYSYNSCSIKKATSALARYTVMPNTWMDNVAGY